MRRFPWGRGWSARRIGALGVWVLLACYGFWGAMRGEAIAPRHAPMEPNNQRMVIWSTQVGPTLAQWADAETVGYFAEPKGARADRRAIMSYVFSPHRITDRQRTRWVILDLADDAAVTRWIQQHHAARRIDFDAGLALVELDRP